MKILGCRCVCTLGPSEAEGLTILHGLHQKFFTREIIQLTAMCILLELYFGSYCNCKLLKTSSPDQIPRGKPWDEFKFKFSHEIEQAIFNGQRPTIPKVRAAQLEFVTVTCIKGTFEPFALLIRKCWQAEPSKRPVFERIAAFLSRLRGLNRDRIGWHVTNRKVN